MRIIESQSQKETLEVVRPFGPDPLGWCFRESPACPGWRSRSSVPVARASVAGAPLSLLPSGDEAGSGAAPARTLALRDRVSAPHTASLVLASSPGRRLSFSATVTHLGTRDPPPPPPQCAQGRERTHCLPLGQMSTDATSPSLYRAEPPTLPSPRTHTLSTPSTKKMESPKNSSF